jgi:hypothetical protein
LHAGALTGGSGVWRRFSYNCYDSVVRTTYAGAPEPTSVDLAALAVEQAKQQDAATALGEEASGHVDDTRRFAQEAGRVGRSGGGGGHIVGCPFFCCAVARPSCEG